MIIDCIADLHGYEPILPGGDLLILAGDYTAEDTLIQWAKFFRWLKEQKYERKILIAGNHDGTLETSFPKNEKEAIDLQEEIESDEPIDLEILCDSGTEYKGLNIWGSPWTPWFHGVNPKCESFMDSESYLEERFNKIPQGTDILITHGPMHQILDANSDGHTCGSYSLREAVDRVKPRFHVFGHIHEQGGKRLMYKHHGSNTWCVNCSFVNERYIPKFRHVRLSVQ